MAELWDLGYYIGEVGLRKFRVSGWVYEVLGFIVRS